MERSLVVDAARAGARIDLFIADELAREGGPSWSRSRVQRAIKGGLTRVDGEVVTRPNTPLAAGQTITVVLEEGRSSSTDVEGRRIAELTVLHEDDAIIVIDKPAGLVTHPTARQASGTVSDLAVARYGPLPEVQGADRPGIVHRLDRLTSGVMVLGRTVEALEHLKAQFKARTVVKTYHAIVHGTPRFDTEWLTGAIEPAPRSHDRMRVVPFSAVVEDDEEEDEAPQRGRPAETFIERLEEFPGATLLAAHPKTGRTHQIRVHLQAAGLPIVGDRVYGPGGALKVKLPKGAPALERPALHARRLEFDHPVDGRRLAFEAELPADMARLLAFLRDAAGAR